MKPEVMRAQLRPAYTIIGSLIGILMGVSTLVWMAYDTNRRVDKRQELKEAKVAYVVRELNHVVTRRKDINLGFFVEGNTQLGSSRSDTTTINGDLIVTGKIVQR